MIRVTLRIGNISGTHQEDEEPESSENGKRLSKSHIKLPGTRGSTYTMRDDLLRINREHTCRAIPGGNLVPVLARRLGRFQEDSDLCLHRYRKG